MNYKGRFFLSTLGGMGYNLINQEGWRAGPIVKYHGGRREDGDQDNFIGDQNTTDLQGLGDIEGTAELGGFVEFTNDFLNASLEVRQATDGHKGAIGDVSVKYVGSLFVGGKTVSFGVRPKISMGDSDYLGAFFGINETQANDSGLSPYEVNGGLLSYGVHGSLVVPVTGRVSLIGFGGVHLCRCRNSYIKRFKSMSTNILRFGALASLGCAATFIFGFVLLLTQLMFYVEQKGNPAFAVQFVLENHALLSLWNFVIYIAFGVFLTVLIIVLHRRLSPLNPVLSQLAFVFGTVWVTLVMSSGMVANIGLTRVVEMVETQPALAPSLWLSVFTIKEALGGSNELVGGLWVTLVSVMMWQSRGYQRVLVFTGLVAGTTGIASTAPLMSELGAVFGLLLIAWFVYLSVEMMRISRSFGLTHPF